MQKQTLAEKLGITTSAICQWETKGKIPSGQLFEVGYALIVLDCATFAKELYISKKELTSNPMLLILKLKEKPSILFDKFLIKRPKS